MKLQSIIQSLTGLFFVLNMNSQNMTIASGGNLTTSDGAEITVKGSLVVATGGTFELKNATLKVDGVSNSGKINYIKTLANSNWFGISSPVKNQNIKEFAARTPLDSGENSHIHNKGIERYSNEKDDWEIYQDQSDEWGDFKEGKARHQNDPRPLDETCACPTCQNYSRAYLHHVFRAQEMISGMLLTWHNLHYYQDLMQSMRDAIAAGVFGPFQEKFHAERARGDIEPL